MPPIDTTAPNLFSISPADAATGVAVGSNIVLSFNESIQRGTGLIEIRSDSATGTLVESYNAATSSNLSTSVNTLTINPTSNLANNTQYFVTIPSSAIKDLAGNSYAGTSSYDFTTAAPADDYSSYSTVGTGLVTVGGSTTGNLEFAGDADWFAVTLTAGHTYQMRLSSSSVNSYLQLFQSSTTSSWLASDNDAGGSLNSLFTYTPTTSGTYYLEASDYPLSATGAYSVSVTDITPSDTTAPTVSSFSPEDAATGVAVSSNIVVTFSEAVQKGTGTTAIHSGSATGTVVESYNVATSTNVTLSGSTLTINPTSNLGSSTNYFVTFDAGSIKDLANNSYTGTSTYNFTTATPSDTTAPTITSFAPADGSAKVAIGNDIVLTFDEPIQRRTGTIQIHSGSATGPLVSSYDAATSTNLSVSGSTLTINPSADLGYNTHYFVTIGTNAIQDFAGNSVIGPSSYDFTTANNVSGAYVTLGAATATTVGSSTPGYFDGSTDNWFSVNLIAGQTYRLRMNSASAIDCFLMLTDNGGSILAYDDNGGGGLNALITYKPLTSGTYYLNASSADNSSGAYNVSVNDSDTTAPAVSTFSPTDAATNVAINSNIVLTFNEAIQRGSGTIGIHRDSATGTLMESYNAATDTAHLAISGNTLTINPAANFASNTHYFVTFGGDTIQDLGGNNYAGTSGYDFTTASISTTTAQLIVDSSAAGNIAAAGDLQIFSLGLTAGRTYELHMNTSSSVDPLLTLFDSSSNVIALDNNSGGGVNSLITYTPTTSGTYYLAASDYGTANGAFSVSANDITAPPPITATPSSASTVGTALVGIGALDILWFLL